MQQILACFPLHNLTLIEFGQLVVVHSDPTQTWSHTRHEPHVRAERGMGQALRIAQRSNTSSTPHTWRTRICCTMHSHGRMLLVMSVRGMCCSRQPPTTSTARMRPAGMAWCIASLLCRMGRHFAHGIACDSNCTNKHVRARPSCRSLCWALHPKCMLSCDADGMCMQALAFDCCVGCCAMP